MYLFIHRDSLVDRSNVKRQDHDEAKVAPDTVLRETRLTDEITEMIVGSEMTEEVGEGGTISVAVTISATEIFVAVTGMTETSVEMIGISAVMTTVVDVLGVAERDGSR